MFKLLISNLNYQIDLHNDQFECQGCTRDALGLTVVVKGQWVAVEVKYALREARHLTF